MSDMINRQDAIDALKGLPTWWADSGGYYGGAQPPMEALLDPEDAVSAIENLPSADAEMNSKLFRIGEVLVEVSKEHITAEQGVKKIGVIMRGYDI